MRVPLFSSFHSGKVPALLLTLSLLACGLPQNAPADEADLRVELSPINLDSKNPQRRQFGNLTLLSAFQLRSKDQRFGGLSGLSVGSDGKLYAVSDRGYWLSAAMKSEADGALVDLADWRITPILTPSNKPVAGKWRDAEALTRDRDGSFLVAFEGVHRIWRYRPPPLTFESTPVDVPLPPGVKRAPSNGGIEGLAVLSDGRLLALTEEYENPDGSSKGWLIHKDQFMELSYLPAPGFRVTDCAALTNGDLIVLERRYVRFGILSARLTLVKAKSIQPGAKLAGQELVKLEQPLAVDNFEGIAVQPSPRGTIIYLVSDDNYSPFQQTLLLQFLVPRENHQQ
jgi:hypothetical protein